MNYTVESELRALATKLLEESERATREAQEGYDAQKNWKAKYMAVEVIIQKKRERE